MKFGIALTPNRHTNELLKLVKWAENSGLDYAWLSESSPGPKVRHTIAELAYLASKTTRIKFGVGIMSPYKWHPALMAVAFHTLNEIYGDRFILGIGPGGEGWLNYIGMKWNKPYTAVKEALDIIQPLFNGDAITYKGQLFAANNVQLDPKPKTRIPVYLAARQKKMMQLIGERADGAVLAAPPSTVAYALEHFKKGAAKTRRSLSEVDVGNWMRFSISENRTKARDIVREGVAGVLAFTPAFTAKLSGIDLKRAEKIKELRWSNSQEAGKLVSEKMIDEFAVAGDPSDIIKLLGIFKDSGMTQAMIGDPFGPNRDEALKLIEKEVLPSF